MATINGTAGANTLVGTSGADTIRGFGGDDVILAGAGNDTVQGGDGNDFIVGGAGDDVLDGGNGNDTLFDDSGSNRFTGGAGNDRITSANALLAVIDAGDGDDIVTTTGTTLVEIAGGIGNDDITISGAALAHVDSGAGADRIRVSDVSSFTLVESGSGDDVIEIAAARSGVIAGSGNDRIVVAVGAEQVTIAGGTGADTVVLQTASARVTITDFVAGPAGDVLDISRILTGLNGWDQSANPFAAGYLRVTQSGADTLLQVDLNGTNGASGWQTVTTLQGVAAATLGVANFGPAYPPNGSAPAGSTIVGTALEDTLTGTIGADTIYGRDGNDVISGGGGNDRLYGEGGDDVFTDTLGANTITGGAGRDTIVIGAPVKAASTVTDFTAGAAGDVVSVEPLLRSASTWDGASNPFESGHLRVTQAGADTLVEFAADGAAYATLLVLQNVSASALTAGNFGGVFDPSPLNVITGTEGDDVLTGTDRKDQILALGGNDTLDGGLGDDILDGGAGNDTFEDHSGANTFIGGDGDDTFRVYSGGSTVYGGAGANVTYVYANGAGDVTTVHGGDDAEAVWLEGAAVVDLGGGDDGVIFDNALAGSRVTLGAGSDIVVVNSRDVPASTVTDFRTGAGGDRIWADLPLTDTSTGWFIELNPFAAGFLRFVQSGSDTLLQLDMDAQRNGDDFTTVLRLENVVRETLTADNIYRFGYDPLSGAEPDRTVTGDDLDNTFTDGNGNDTLSGLGGNDRIEAMIGDDTLIGGDGNDILIDRWGNNSFYGGEGNDTIMGEHGDRAYAEGGAGNDSINLFVHDYAEAYGGSGDDGVTVSAALVYADGGDGNDAMTMYGNGTLLAGAGNDRVFVTQNGAGTVDLGSGADILTLDMTGNAPRSITVSTGAGNDSVALWSDLAAPADVVITDFQRANLTAGDTLDIAQVLIGNDGERLRSVVTRDNVNEYVKFEVHGNDTGLYVDADGAGANADFALILTLANTAQFNMTVDNMLFSPNRALSVGDF